MIRINLLRDTGGGGKTPKIVSQGVPSALSPEETKTLVVKIALFLMPIVLISGYRQYVVGLTQNEINSLSLELRDVNGKLKALDPAIKELEKFQEEKRKLDSQLEIIKRLSKERLLNVKSLDALQGIIPAKAWLSALKIREKKVELEGFAVNDIVISDFLQGLGSSIFFANVVLVGSEEVKRKDGVVKKFIIRCTLENL